MFQPLLQADNIYVLDLSESQLIQFKAEFSVFRGSPGYFSRLQLAGFFFVSVTVINTHAILSRMVGARN